MLCDNQKKAETLLQNREKGQSAALKTIIIMDPFNSELVERGTKCGVDIVSLQDVEVMHVEHKLSGDSLLTGFRMNNCFRSVLATITVRSTNMIGNMFCFMFHRLWGKAIFKSQL